jgi:sn-glycerol 3-phosphate transport system ATP-binding protein
MANASLQDVKKSFGELEILHGINCEIHDGEFIVILGPSGCGKSTLLRLIAGLEKISSGTIKIEEKTVNNLEPAERDIAMVFQNYALYPHMTVFNNMAYGLKIRKLPKIEIEQRVQKAAEILELSELLSRKPRQLSGGQRQRVAMGRCIVREPKLFLFDEPLSNLDAKLRVQMRLEIRRLHKRLNITSVYVTHDQVEAMTLADRLIVMDRGYAGQIGTPLEIYQKPANRFVAGFIGSPAMNFFDSSISDDGKFLELPSKELLSLSGHELPDNKDQHVTVGIRPEHMVVCDESEVQFHLKTDLVEKLGADTLVHGFFKDDGVALTVRLNGVQSFEMDEILPLKIELKNVHIFDHDSGNRLN